MSPNATLRLLEVNTSDISFFNNGTIIFLNFVTWNCNGIPLKKIQIILIENYIFLCNIPVRFLKIIFPNIFDETRFYRVYLICAKQRGRKRQSPTLHKLKECQRFDTNHFFLFCVYHTHIHTRNFFSPMKVCTFSFQNCFYPHLLFNMPKLIFD